MQKPPPSPPDTTLREAIYHIKVQPFQRSNHGTFQLLYTRIDTAASIIHTSTMANTLSTGHHPSAKHNTARADKSRNTTQTKSSTSTNVHPSKDELWKPNFNRRQSWNREEKKHEMQHAMMMRSDPMDKPSSKVSGYSENLSLQRWQR